MAYSTIITYVLWLTLGLFGAHHFYLRRDRHAFVWLWTFGGWLGIGWLLEVFRLPHYVEYANKEARYVLNDDVAHRPRRFPSWSMKRMIGEGTFALWLGSCAMSAIPADIEDARIWLSAAVGPLGAALGFHTVANIGREQCDLIVCLVTSYLMFPFLLRSYDTLQSTLTTGVLVMLIVLNFNWGPNDEDSDDDDDDSWCSCLRRAWAKRAKRYRRRRPVRRNNCTRVVLFCLSCLVLGSCLSFAIFYNAEVVTSHGETVKLKDAMHNFFASPAWAAFRQSGWRPVFESLKADSMNEFFEKLVASFDVGGEQRAYQILNLTQFATEKDINDRYRDLVKKYHPDKFVNLNEEEKKAVEDRFIEIQQAYERISTIKSKRMIKNRKSEL